MKFPKRIQTAKHVYEVGQRGAYVYFCVAGERDLSKRAVKIDKLTKRFALTAGETDELNTMLASLDKDREVKAADANRQSWYTYQKQEGL